MLNIVGKTHLSTMKFPRSTYMCYIRRRGDSPEATQRVLQELLETFAPLFAGASVKGGHGAVVLLRRRTLNIQTTRRVTSQSARENQRGKAGASPENFELRHVLIFSFLFLCIYYAPNLKCKRIALEKTNRFVRLRFIFVSYRYYGCIIKLGQYYILHATDVHLSSLYYSWCALGAVYCNF